MCSESTNFTEVHKKYPRDFKDRGDGIPYFKNVSIPRIYNSINYSFRDYMEIVIDTNLSLSSDPFECAFASMLTKTMTAAANITLRLKRDKHSNSQLQLLIRLANQLVQPSKPPSISLRVV